ncbi:TetR/AcrR family transcriptional regulator [Labrys neptuniae]
MEQRTDDKSGGDEHWRDVRRNNLLDAASRIFARQGYEAASVDDIAFEAGIGKATIYRYFSSKEALFEAVFAQALDDLEVRLDAALLREGDFATRLTHLVAEIVPTVRTHLSTIRDLSEGENSKRRIFRRRRAAISQRLITVIEEAQRRGEARPFDTDMAARLLIGMAWIGVGADYLSDSEVTHTVIDMALNGLAQGRPVPEDRVTRLDPGRRRRERGTSS